MATKVQYRAHDHHLEVPGRGRIEPDSGGLIAPTSVVEDVALSSLNAALGRYEYYISPGSIELNLVDIDPEYLTPDTPGGPHSLSWAPQAGFVVNGVVFSADEPDVTRLEAAARPLLDRYRAELLSIDPDLQNGAWVIFITARVPTRGKTVGDLVGFIERLEEIFDAVLSGGFDAAAAAHVIRAGMSDLLVDHHENEWLEAKSAPYRLDDDRGRYELAKDVAMFANHGGGLVMIGAKTKRTPTGDQIRTINGCLKRDFSVPRYRAVLRDRLFPAIEDAVIEWIPNLSGERGVGLIEVPPQGESIKPFLVKGTGDSGPGLGFSWPRREGDGAVAPSIESIHALIKAGQYVFAAESAEAQVENLRSELDQIRDGSLPLFLAGVPAAARAAGFDVVYSTNGLTFEKEGQEPFSVSKETLGPPADIGQRNRVLEELGKRGLPVKRLRSGFLAPRDSS